MIIYTNYMLKLNLMYFKLKFIIFINLNKLFLNFYLNQVLEIII